MIFPYPLPEPGKDPPWPQASFFGQFRLPVFLKRRDTISNPLWFGAAMP